MKCFERIVTACCRVNTAIVHCVKVDSLESLRKAVVGWSSSWMAVPQNKPCGKAIAHRAPVGNKLLSQSAERGDDPAERHHSENQSHHLGKEIVLPDA